MKVRMLLAAVAAAGVCVAPALAQPTGGKPGATPSGQPATPAQPSKPTTGAPTQPGKPGDKPAGMPEGMPSMEEMMKMSAPGAEHAQLAQQFEGTWNTTVVCKMAPDAPESTTTGTSEQKMVLNGRYLSQHFKGSMSIPGMGEMPFEGMGITGFDNAKKAWFGTWIDSMGTGVMLSSGTYDAATKTYTFKGSYEDPAMGHMDMREVIKVESPDKHVMEFYMPAGPGQPEFKGMTITYTRAKGGEGMGRTNAPTAAPGNSGNAPGRTPGATPKTGGRP